MMAGDGIERLPDPSNEARTKLEEAYPAEWHGWSALEVDVHRAFILRQAALSAPASVPFADMRALADRLESAGDHVPQTMASYQYARTQGLRLAAAFMDLAAQYGQPIEFRIYPPGLEVPADNLESVEFDYICDCLRRTFARATGAASDGYVGAVARGEYNVVTDTFRLYFRGVAFGQLADALRWINDLDEYEFAPWQDNLSPPFLRVHWRRRPKGNLTTFTQLVPNDWRRIYEVWHESEWVRQILWGELPPLRMAQLLLFWDTLKLRDITLLMRLRIAADGLRLNAKGRGRRVLDHASQKKADA
jgi:hypothetical protein